MGELVKELGSVPYRCQTLVAWAWSLGQFSVAVSSRVLIGKQRYLFISATHYC